MQGARGDMRLVAAAIGFVLVIVAAQGLATVSYPAADRADAGAVLGRTGFAYLTTLRTFGAAVLWNRLEPQFHDYYQDTKLVEQQHLLPTLAVVQALDPQFQQAYYLSSFVVFMRGDEKTGLAIAHEGVENNPRSGFMRANLAQLLLLQDKKANMAEVLENAEFGLREDAEYADADEQFESWAIFRDAYALSGDQAMADRIQSVLDQMKADGYGLGDHDHDGDGEQDH